MTEDVEPEIDRLLNRNDRAGNLLSSTVFVWFIVFVFLNAQPYSVIYFWINLIFAIIATLIIIISLRTGSRLIKLFEIRDDLTSQEKN